MSLRALKSPHWKLAALALFLTAGLGAADRRPHCELVAQGLDIGQLRTAKGANKPLLFAVESETKLREYTVRQGKLAARDLLGGQRIQLINVSPSASVAFVEDQWNDEFCLVDVAKAQVRWRRALSDFPRRGKPGNIFGVISACWNQKETAIVVSLMWGTTVLIDSETGASKRFFIAPEDEMVASSVICENDNLVVIANEFLDIRVYRLEDGKLVKSLNIPGPLGDVVQAPTTLNVNGGAVLIDDVLSGEAYVLSPSVRKNPLLTLKLDEGWSRTEIAFNGGRRLAFGYRQKLILYTASGTKLDTLECRRWVDNIWIKQVAWFGRDLLVEDTANGLLLVSTDDL